MSAVIEFACMRTAVRAIEVGTNASITNGRQGTNASCSVSFLLLKLLPIGVGVRGGE